MSEGEPGAVGGSVPDKAEQADAPVPQVSFKQFNQQVQLIVPSLIEQPASASPQ